MKQSPVLFSIGLLLVAGFAVSVIAGFNVGQANGIAAGRHWRDHEFTLEKATVALNLTPGQRAKAEPFISDARPRIVSIEAESRRKRHEVVDNALTGIRPLLTPDQQKKLDDLQKARQDLHAARDTVRALTER